MRSNHDSSSFKPPSSSLPTNHPPTSFNSTGAAAEKTRKVKAVYFIAFFLWFLVLRVTSPSMGV